MKQHLKEQQLDDYIEIRVGDDLNIIIIYVLRCIHSSFLVYTCCVAYFWYSSCCLQWCDNIGEFKAQLFCCFRFLILQYRMFDIINNTYFILLFYIQGFKQNIYNNKVLQWNYCIKNENDLIRIVIIKLILKS